MSDSESADTFEAKIAPVLERFETRRRETIRKAKLSIAVIAAIAFLVALLVGANAGAQAALFAVIGGAVIGFIAFGAITNPFKKAFKQEVLGAVVSTYDESFRYQATSGISRGAFKASELFKKGIDRYRAEDYVSGLWEKTEFEFSEVHAEYKTTSGSGKNRRTQWHTIFKGIFFIADFHKEFRTRTIVLPDTAEKVFGFLGRKLQDWNFARPDVVRLEDPDFEREFCVYADDQVEARYILSPSLMQRILRLKRKFGDKVFLSFLHSKVYIALSSSKNCFEPKMFEPVDMSLIDEYKEDLDLIVGIVDDLNLNTRVWTKE
ncbi:hypothetical protein VDG1235_1210 [Verrucomicrobiia bacterium DG1235]|nr:hypothetical protein VDG1235_1210 [Verrucomicrobiae bacterium DG1235]